MIEFNCPKCNKDSYSSSAKAFTACPFCGVPFSGEHGSERRVEKRVQSEIPFEFAHGGTNHEALISDLSEYGMGINIYGSPTLNSGDVIDLSIRGFQVRVKVMWVKSMSTESLAGLRRLN
jgi:hypothetical protein